jgi:hypothetical protein
MSCLQVDRHDVTFRASQLCSYYASIIPLYRPRKYFIRFIHALHDGPFASADLGCFNLEVVDVQRIGRMTVELIDFLF